DFFLSGENNQDAITGTESVSIYLRFGWMLFLALRIHVFSQFKGLVTCTNGLVSILTNISVLSVRKGTKGVDLISSLCNIYQTLEDDLLKMIEKANTLIIDGLTYFQDLVEEISIISSIRILERDYEDAIHDRGELDERMFVNEEDSLFGSGSVSEGAANISGVK
ncbi:hypothetical protein KI387_015589, partial [Taxus chinensis]